jgi:hypothetical protein
MKAKGLTIASKMHVHLQNVEWEGFTGKVSRDIHEIGWNITTYLFYQTMQSIELNSPSSSILQPDSPLIPPSTKQAQKPISTLLFSSSPRTTFDFFIPTHPRRLLEAKVIRVERIFPARGKCVEEARIFFIFIQSSSGTFGS